jgi:hypothetical protein
MAPTFRGRPAPTGGRLTIGGSPFPYRRRRRSAFSRFTLPRAIVAGLVVFGAVGAFTPSAASAVTDPATTPTPATSASDTPVPAATESAATGAGAALTPSASPAVAAAGQPSVTVVLFDTDIVLVGGSAFTPSADVTIKADAGDLGGSATAKAGTDGRFLIGFQVPDNFSGHVAVTAASGGKQAQGSLAVNVAPQPAATTATPTPAVTPPAAPPAATGGLDAKGKLSGLPWMSGVHPSNELAPYLSFGAWRGRPIDVAVVFTIRDSGWDTMVKPSWPVDMFKTFAGKLVISQPTFPEGQGSNAECATGAYDQHWKDFGTFLVQNNRADSIVRLGWEFNGTYMYWHADASGNDFKTCYQKIVTAIRSTDPKVEMDWTINAHNSPVPSSGNPFDAYPGDAYVDFVGIDAYDHYPASKDQATFDKQCNTENGLCYFMNFARQHGKKVGVGEWAVASCSGDGGGDNPFYITAMHAIFVANQDVMGYESYYHDPMPNNVCSTIEDGGQNPKSAAVYKQLWGTG